MRGILLVSVILLLSACATQPLPRGPVETREATPARVLPPPPASLPPAVEVQPETPPQPPPAAPGTPSSSLLASVDAAIAAGELEQAAALCERALRISPRDPWLWYRLASIRFEQKRYAEVSGLARRAASYAGNDASLARGIDRLLEQSRAALNATAD